MTFLASPGVLFERTGTAFQVGLLAMVLLVSLFVRRPWCRYLCAIRPVADLVRKLQRELIAHSRRKPGFRTFEELERRLASVSIPVIFIAEGGNLRPYLKELTQVCGEAAERLGCLTDETLNRLVDGKLTEPQAERARRHLSQCETLSATVGMVPDTQWPPVSTFIGPEVTTLRAMEYRWGICPTSTERGLDYFTVTAGGTR